MSDLHQQDTSDTAAGFSRRRRAMGVVVLLVIIAVLAFAIVKLLPQKTTPSTVAAIDSDAVAAYEAALDAELPIYVLFHSRSCQPCIEIDAVAQEVVPEYAGRVSFVDVITDDPAGKELAARLPFQFIPTSYFLAADGSVADMYTGVLDATAMRARLDTLLEEE
ncbi:MAG: thioredoxin domain-containing protein [Coriobacteriia bacterium]|nr:thioredoxin domain-containing protein [Coriobacteriia bacterium]